MSNGNGLNANLEIRNPNHLIIVTSALLKQHPDQVETLSPFYDLRAERSQGGPVFETFKEQVRMMGRITDPVKIAKVEGIGDVVVDGRQRVRAAVALGFPTVPVIFEEVSTRNIVFVELLSNLARSENSTLENAHAFKKALTQGLTPQEVAKAAGVSDTTILNTIYLGEMPKEIHKMIDSGNLSPTAALNLRKFGKKAAKGSGLSKVYDDEAKKAMLEAVSALDVEARLSGKRITGNQTKFARNSKARPEGSLTGKQWDAIVADEKTPITYALLIQVFRGKISWQQARQQQPEALAFLRPIEPQPKPKAEKKAKVAKEKEEKFDTNPQVDTTNVMDMFQ